MTPTINFQKSNGLVPAIIQDAENGTVYMLGYMNEEAFQKTKTTGFVHFFSRSRNKLWMKGEESGNKLKVVEVKTDCDADTILKKVRLVGNAVCHTGNISCFFTDV